MTETAKVEGTNGKQAENGDMSLLDKDIYKQVKRNLKIHKSILDYLNVGSLNDISYLTKGPDHLTHR